MIAPPVCPAHSAEGRSSREYTVTESSVGSRLTALNVGRAGATSRSSQSRDTANGGATST